MPYSHIHSRHVLLALKSHARSDKIFGLHFRRIGSGPWLATKATLLDTSTSVDDSAAVRGDFAASPNYQGCPADGLRGFFQCGSCLRLTSSDASFGDTVTCAWCTNTGLLSTRMMTATQTRE